MNNLELYFLMCTYEQHKRIKYVANNGSVILLIIHMLLAYFHGS